MCREAPIAADFVWAHDFVWQTHQIRRCTSDFLGTAFISDQELRNNHNLALLLPAEQNMHRKHAHDLHMSHHPPPALPLVECMVFPCDVLFTCLCQSVSYYYRYILTHEMKDTIMTILVTYHEQRSDLDLIWLNAISEAAAVAKKVGAAAHWPAPCTPLCNCNPA